MTYGFRSERDLNVQKVKFAREGGNVLRCHAQRGIREYPVSGHTFNMLCLLRILYPDAPKELIWAVLQHDVPERIVGDIPHPAKHIGFIDATYLKETESELQVLVFGEDPESDLSEEDLLWFRGLDMIEFYLYCRDEQMLGNLSMETKLLAVSKHIRDRKHHYHPKIVDFFFQVESDGWETLSDKGE